MWLRSNHKLFSLTFRSDSCCYILSNGKFAVLHPSFLLFECVALTSTVNPFKARLWKGLNITKYFVQRENPLMQIWQWRPWTIFFLIFLYEIDWVKRQAWLWALTKCLTCKRLAWMSKTSLWNFPENNFFSRTICHHNFWAATLKQILLVWIVR